jgi:hypothetical protein
MLIISDAGISTHYHIVIVIQHPLLPALKTTSLKMVEDTMHIKKAVSGDIEHLVVSLN